MQAHPEASRVQTTFLPPPLIMTKNVEVNYPGLQIWKEGSGLKSIWRDDYMAFSKGPQLSALSDTGERYFIGLTDGNQLAIWLHGYNKNAPPNSFSAKHPTISMSYTKLPSGKEFFYVGDATWATKEAMVGVEKYMAGSHLKLIDSPYPHQPLIEAFFRYPPLDGMLLSSPYFYLPVIDSPYPGGQIYGED